MKLSQRVQQLAPSTTLAITAKANAMKKQGLDVIGLGAGEPDFNTPRHILDEAIDAMEKGYTKYTASGGILELKEAIAEKLERDNQLTYDPKTEITVTVGAKGALYNLFQVILDPGDEVIVPAPYWVSYIEQIKLAGGVPVVVEGAEENQFRITPAQLEAAVTEKTKAFILNSPSNPTGVLYPKEELDVLGKVAVDKDLLIVSDEIYEHLIYDPIDHVSIASLSPELYARTIVINGVSKTYAMTGWRIGYAAGPASIIRSMIDLDSHSTSNPTSVAQYAAIAALSGTQEPVYEMIAAFRERRDYVMERLKNMPAISCVRPNGAFYAFLNIEKLLTASGGNFENSDELSKALLEEELVAVVPGSAFGSDRHIRISYATSKMQLEKALDRLEKFFEKQDA
ncbi:pyridoxal phosphate-dependent aminotransferase [Risungbinella massiliensis]|uniref:pyridoxal phosphate-dependent aminotransferase n=1 Tax=Risungbinella massiliensis TaxID=1329796 RepID=UPI0005CBDA3F|nr:pyridoxal phosphate-dependent aminotransferase [Risungbinella massiliensis]